MRELIEGVLRAQDRWTAIEQRYLPAEGPERGASGAQTAGLDGEEAR